MKKYLFLIMFCSLLSIVTLKAQTSWLLTGNSVGTTQYLGTTNSYALNFGVNKTIRMCITPQYGFVGIGTTTPISALHLHSGNVMEGVKYINRFQMTNAATGLSNGNGFIIRQLDKEVALVQQEDALLKIDARNSNGLIVAPNGDVGFGTTIPHQKIHLVGGNNILLTGYSEKGALYRNTEADLLPELRNSPGSPNGSIMFGWLAADACPVGVWGIEYDRSVRGLNFWKPSGSCQGGDWGNYFLFMSDLGNVGIGTSNPTSKLTVKGNILCEAVKIIANVPNADYVFEPDYNLMSLKELESYVNKECHLPDVPSAEQFKEGYQLGDMDEMLLRKVEELTLYLIEQNKKIEALQKELEQLKTTQQKGDQ